MHDIRGYFINIIKATTSGSGSLLLVVCAYIRLTIPQITIE